MRFFGSFLTELASVSWVAFRYVLVSLTVMLVTLSVVTKQFPPPVMSVYHSLKNANSMLDLGGSTSIISKAKMDREKLMKEIEEDQKTTGNGNAPQGQAVVVPEAEQKIKSLEYEVALLKSKLYRAEWEAQQLRTQREATSATATAATK
jgi:hypothetical protein